MTSCRSSGSRLASGSSSSSSRGRRAIASGFSASATPQQVLRHASGLLSTVEIADQMYISVNTVKTHLRNAYRKLAANHCGEAVRRAASSG